MDQLLKMIAVYVMVVMFLWTVLSCASVEAYEIAGVDVGDQRMKMIEVYGMVVMLLWTLVAYRDGAHEDIG